MIATFIDRNLEKAVREIIEISYSLYMFHIPVLLSLVNELYGKLPIGIVLVTSFIVAFIVASLMYYFVEKPSIMLGKFLTTSRAHKNKDKAKKPVSA